MDYGRIIKLPNATIPNPQIIIPEIRLTHSKPFLVSLPLRMAAALISNTHHNIDPLNTPVTNKIASLVSLSLFAAIPRPANIPMNDKIVKGFVNVRKNVEI